MTNKERKELFLERLKKDPSISTRASADLAVEYDVTDVTINNWLKAAGVKSAPHSKQRVSKITEIFDRFKADVELNNSLLEKPVKVLASLYNVSIPTLTKWIKNDPELTKIKENVKKDGLW